MAIARCPGSALLQAVPCLLITACASYSPAPIDLEHTAQQFAARRLDDPVLARFVGAFFGVPAWERPPAKLTLQQLQAIALYFRPELAAARAELRAAEAGHEVAAQLPNPRAAIGPGVVANPGDASRWILTTGLTFPLGLSGQRSAGAEFVAAEVTAARLAVAQQDQAIRAEVAERAFDLERRQSLLTLTLFTTARHRQLASLVERRASAGAATAGEANAALAAAMQGDLDEVAARREATLARAALASAMGVPVVAIERFEFELPAAGAAPEQPGDDRETAADAAARRLDVAKALCAYARSEAALKLEVCKQWPDLELGPGYEYDQGLHKFRLDLGFTLPLFHGNGAAIEQATAARSAAAAVVESVQARALAAVDAARQMLADRNRELESATAMVDAAAIAMRQVRQRADAGEDDAVTKIESELAHIEAERLQVEQQHEARLAWLRLELELQQPVGAGLLAWQHAAPEDTR